MEVHRTYAALAAKADVQHVHLEQDVDYIMRRVWGLGDVNTQHHGKVLELVVQASDRLPTSAAKDHQKLMVSVAQSHDGMRQSVRQHHDRTRVLATSNHFAIIQAISQACERLDMMASNIGTLTGTSNHQIRKLNTMDGSMEALKSQMRIIGGKAIT